jgi:predicted phage terminase large subunit-like protein
MTEFAAVYRAALRADLGAFAERSHAHLNSGTRILPNWHLDLMSAKLMAVARGEIKRLVINVPPRHLKSLFGSVALPAWMLGHKPTEQIICVSYAQDLSEKLARDCRSVMASGFYQNTFGTRLTHNRQAVGELTTTVGGFRLATSVGGTLTGRGADLIIIDDPIKPDDALSEARRSAANQWYDNTLLSRLNDKRHGRIILIMQRLHEDDLTGHVLQQKGWEVVRLPAIAEQDETCEFPAFAGMRRFRRRAGEALHPAREGLDVLAHMRRAMGEYSFAAQYQQSPAPIDGGMVKRAWLRSYRPADLPATFEMVFQSWDTANKPTELSDYSVCTTWGLAEKRLYLLDVFRARLDYPGLKRAVREQAERHPPSVILIEDKASGTQLIQELQGDGVHAVTRYEPTMDKVMRFHAQTSSFENGLVVLPDKADWLAAYIHELTAFPSSRHDDQVDSTAQRCTGTGSASIRPALSSITSSSSGTRAFRSRHDRTLPAGPPRLHLNCCDFDPIDQVPWLGTSRANSYLMKEHTHATQSICGCKRNCACGG